MPPVTHEPPNGAALPALLRHDLDQAGVSVKELARRLAKEAGTAVESERRGLQRYLKGEVNPEPDKAAAIARALGQPEERYATTARLQVSIQELIAEIGAAVTELHAEVKRVDARARARLAQGQIADRLAKLEERVEQEGQAVRDSLQALLDVLEGPHNGAAAQRSQRGRQASPRKARK